MAVYLIQNKYGEFFTRNLLWTYEQKRAARFHDVRSLVKTCEVEELDDSYMVVDFCDTRLARITVPLKDIISPRPQREFATSELAPVS